MAYAEERRKEWRGLLDLEGGAVAEPGAEWLRPHASGIVPLLPATGEHLKELLGQL